MDYLDMLKDLADGTGDVDKRSAQSILNGARSRLKELEGKVEERLSDGDDLTAPDNRRKPKSEYTRKERADFYQRMRDQNKDPNEEWAKLPE